MAASVTIAPDPSRTCAWRGSWASSASVELAGLTSIAATSGGGVGAVLLHDQFDNAIRAMAFRVRPLFDIPPAPSGYHAPRRTGTFACELACCRPASSRRHLPPSGCHFA